MSKQPITKESFIAQLNHLYKLIENTEEIPQPILRYADYMLNFIASIFIKQQTQSMSDEEIYAMFREAETIARSLLDEKN